MKISRRKSTRPACFIAVVAYVVLAILMLPPNVVLAKEAPPAFSAERVQSAEIFQDLLLRQQVVMHSRYYPLLRHIRQRLLRAPDVRRSMEKYGYTFNYVIVHDPQPNSFASPGGIIFVTDSLLGTLHNNAELYGVLAHETSHVILSHGIRRQREANLLGAVTIAAMMFEKTETLKLATGLLGSYAFLNFDRQQELAADHEGTKLLSEIGVDPWGLSWALDTLRAKTGGLGFESYVSDHPSYRQRQAKIASLIDHSATMKRANPSEPRSSGLRTTYPGTTFLVMFPPGSN